MKVKILLSTLLILFCLNYANTQSHISTGQYGCRLVPSSLNTEKHLCPACAANDLKVKQAKAAEEKRRSDAAIAKANADKAARDLAYKKAQKERDEKNKVTEVGLAMPSNTSLPNSTSSTESSNNLTPPNNDIYSSTPTYSKKEVYTQAAVTAIGSLVNEMNANYERKEAAYERERELKEKNNAKNYEGKFKAEYLPLMNKAIAGDENARMILYFTSDKKELWNYVPQRNKWFKEALNNNNNTDALLQKAKDIQEHPEYFKKDGDNDYNYYIEKAANLGSIDAMILMAKYYDSKFYNTKTSLDTKKAIEFYNKAAENGSPIAMYYLGMIYKYGIVSDLRGSEKYYKTLPQFDVILDDKIAFNWFLKSCETFSRADYQESIFAKSIKYNYFGMFGCVDHYDALKNCYMELSIIYKEGEIVAKDKDKAKKFENLANSLYSNRNFQKFNLEWEN